MKDSTTKETIFAYDEADLNSYNIFNINEVLNSNLQEPSQLGKILTNIDKYDENMCCRIESLCEKCADIFEWPNEKLNATHIAEHKIVTTDSAPVNVKQYRYSPMLKDEIERQVGNK